MKEHLVLTLVGPDKPGIVERVSAVVGRSDASWQASRMARLAGQFAGVLELAVSPQKKAELLASFRELDDGALVVVAHDARAEVREKHGVVVDLVGTDRVGLVRELSAVFSKRGVNVDELATETEEAPMVGGTVFRMTAFLQCPPGVSAEQIRGDLEAVADDLMVEMRHVKSD